MGTASISRPKSDYGDITELLVDYKMLPEGDSGIYLRGVPQVQIWDTTKGDPRGLGQDKGSGGLWNNAKGSPGKAPLVAGRQTARASGTTIRIIMVGSRVTVWLNDQLVVDHAILENYFERNKPADQRLPILPRGPIQLQTHGSEIRWRNLFVREFSAAMRRRQDPREPVRPGRLRVDLQWQRTSPAGRWIRWSARPGRGREGSGRLPWFWQEKKRRGTRTGIPS